MGSSRGAQGSGDGPMRIQVTAEHKAVGRQDTSEHLPKEDLEATSMRGIQESAPIGFVPHGSRASLKVLQGPAKGQLFPLDQPYNTIGRATNNSVVIRDEFVSSSHAAIYFSQSMEWRLEDLGSRNGTLLNGSKVKEFAIHNGDKIFIGDHLFLFAVEQD